MFQAGTVLPETGLERCQRNGRGLILDLGEWGHNSDTGQVWRGSFKTGLTIRRASWSSPTVEELALHNMLLAVRASENQFLRAATKPFRFLLDTLVSNRKPPSGANWPRPRIMELFT